MTQPTPLTNSRRRFEKVTYTPVKTRTPDSPDEGDALGLAAMVRALQITPSELTRLGESVVGRGPREALDAIRQLTSAVSGALALQATAKLGSTPTQDLVTVAGALADVRNGTLDEIASNVRVLDAAMLRAQNAAEHQAEPATQPNHAPQAGQSVVAAALPRVESSLLGRVGSLEQIAVDAPAPSGRRVRVEATTALATVVAGIAPVRVPSRLSADPAVRLALGSALAERTGNILSWAAEKEPAALARLTDIARNYVAMDQASLAPLAALPEITRLAQVTQLFMDALTRRDLEPIGLLHLERLVLTPIAIERGELVYSLPLAPKEKVTLAHKEWSTREEEYQRYIEDYFENFSEQGVAQTDDLSMSSDTQTMHSNALSMSNALTTSTGMGITGTVDATTGAATSTVDDATALQQSKSQSRTVTSRASARSIKDQKISFTVTTVSGTQDFTARVLENPAADRSMRIDYYRRMRKWQVDLYRYGVRMTYDVVLPDPGQKLRALQEDLRDIDAQLNTQFDVGLVPSDIQPWTWESYADQHGAVLPPPPAAYRIEKTKVLDKYPPVDTQQANGLNWVQSHYMEELSFTIPDDYQLDGLTATVEASTWPSGVGAQWITVTAGGLRQTFDAGSTGYLLGSVDLDVTQLPQLASQPVTVEFRHKGTDAGSLTLLASVSPTESAMAVWRFKCWTLLKEAALSDYLQRQDQARKRRTDILQQIDSGDALTLRRLEREQIMRLVLEWLFPGFDDASSILEALPSPGGLDQGTWQKVMEYGEYIKFVHTAIDWDNISVFLYPYFWDTIERQDEKLLLDHPDAAHREFLRAGAARVILPIQPGFEEQVVSLLDQGQFGSIDIQNRFRKVIDDVQAANDKYIETTQPGPGNTGDDPREPGILVGSWTDYTPSGALDIDVSTAPVVSNP
jgi:hypothetical protein